jgi:hypothetical protein
MVAVYQVFLISCGSYLSEKLEITVRASTATSTVSTEHISYFPVSGGDHTGDGEGHS